jgi:hypothetical protein
VKYKLKAVACLVSLAFLAACDEPPPEIVPAAGSFALPGACGTVVAAPDGNIFTWSRSSSTSFKVDKRSATGTVIWTASLPGATECTGSALITGDLIVPTGDSIFSLSGLNGSVKWRVPGSFARIATGNDAKVYVVTAPALSQPTFAAYNGVTGVPVWSRTIFDRGAPYLNEPLGTLYFVRRGGALAVNTSGVVQWESPITSTDKSEDAAIAADGTILINRDNTNFSALTAYTQQGVQKWTNNISTPRNFVGAPVIDDSATVYSASCGQTATGCFVLALSVATGELIWRKDFESIASDIVVDSKRTVYLIARLSTATTYQLFGLRKGATASLVPADGIATSSSHPLMIHGNKLLYYVGTDAVVYTPTAGITVNAAWPMAKHDPMRTARRPTLFLPD